MKKQTDTQALNAHGDFETIFKYDEAKIEQIKQALHDRRWDHFLMLHERVDRLAALHDLMMLHGVVDIGDRWQYFRALWVDSETITQQFDQWAELIRMADEDDQLDDIMTTDDQILIEALDFPLVVYRGAIADRNERGMSFTRSKKLAEWFARRFVNDADAVLITAEVTREQVAFISTERDEDEVVIHPDHLEEVFEDAEVRPIR